MPTAPVAYEASARNTYEARVRRALVALGSKDPEADIEATNAYLEHCKKLKLDPAVTAAGIYATVHHRHEPTSVLRGAAAGEAKRKSRDRLPEYEQKVEKQLVDLGFSPGVASVAMQNHGALIRDAFNDGDPAWVVADRINKFEREESHIPLRESPTRDEWEVTVRRHGTIEKLYQAAGRKPDEIVGQNVVFGEFYDDEKAQAFAHKMMRAGYFSMFGPRPKSQAASGAAEAPRYGRRRGSYVDPQEQERLERGRKRQAEYWEKKEKLTSGLTRVSAEDLIYKYKRSVPESGRETVAVLSDPKTNEPQAILWKWEGGGHGESGGSSTNFWRWPGILPAGSEGAAEAPRKKRGVARDSAPCNRLERDGMAGDCSVLAKEIGPIETDKDLYRLFAPRMRKEPQEVFYVACVDVHGRLCAFTELARGQVSSVHVTAAQVTNFVLSVTPLPSAYACGHNHPGGEARPSEADKKLTSDIKKSRGEAMREIVFMDHLIVAGGEKNREYFSFTDNAIHHAPR